MSDTTQGPSDRERQLQELIADYLEAASSGQAPQREEWLLAHPDLADDLRRFLDNHEWMHRLGGSLHLENDSASPPTLPESETPHLAGLGKVRYFGDYELLAEIARGGMGVVYRARQVSLNRVVALKMILAGQLAGDRDVQRFRAEAEAVANLDHPNIVPLYETGEHEGQHYFSMKFVEGGSLVGAMPSLLGNPRRAATLLASVARAIHHAHARGILHRDLKPANILLDRDEVPLVTDFGLARPVDGVGTPPESGAIVGTAPYMAPEQARAERQLTTAADVYGLGAILYECLTGRPPFQAENLMDTLLQVIDREPEHPRAINPQAEADLCVIALKCLRKEPARRYESAAALADELERWLRGEPILARPAGVMERAWRWARRNPAVAGLVAAVGMLLVAGTVTAWLLAGWALAEKGRATEAAGVAENEAIRAGAKAREALNEKERAEAQKKEADRLRDRAEWLVYAGKLALAQREWQDNNVARALELLSECQWNLRGWEHRHLWTLYNSNQVTFRGHTGSVNSVAYSPDGKRIVSGSWDQTVKVWDAEKGEEVVSLNGYMGYVYCVAYSPDGKRIVLV